MVFRHTLPVGQDFGRERRLFRVTIEEDLYVDLRPLDVRRYLETLDVQSATGFEPYGLPKAGHRRVENATRVLPLLTDRLWPAVGRDPRLGPRSAADLPQSMHR